MVPLAVLYWRYYGGMVKMNIDKALQRQLTERQRKKLTHGGVERIWSRKQIEQAFIETFELVGGVPRLAIWANDPSNYGQFLNLLMKLAPKDVGEKMGGAVLEYRSNLNLRPLNGQQSQQLRRDDPAAVEGVVISVTDNVDKDL